MTFEAEKTIEAEKTNMWLFVGGKCTRGDFCSCFGRSYGLYIIRVPIRQTPSFYSTHKERFGFAKSDNIVLDA
ncbi:MAG: hypothetical protein CL920_38840 [Deltaproteobacteria bacterium]|nr:hypothetical protein [Deltaproteobacteria bacterium]